MPVNRENYVAITKELESKAVTLVAVSKTKPIEDILELYESGHRDFGENYVQELVSKQEQLPKDIRWHFIGHLQTNKVKYIAPFVNLIHGVDSLKLLREVDKQGQKQNRVIDVLLQVHIAMEETKFGLDDQELQSILDSEASQLKYARIRGLMGMASFTDVQGAVRKEFRRLKTLFDRYSGKTDFNILSMGMSGDYRIAMEEGSTLVRIGSLLFGEREKR